MSEPKPCPFCAVTGEWSQDDGAWAFDHVETEDHTCLLGDIRFVVPGKMLKEWNNRPGEDAARREALEQACADPAVIEALAAVEHYQWARWFRYQRDHDTSDNITRWEHQAVTPYKELSEREKESDRKEARLALAEIRAAFAAREGK